MNGTELLPRCGRVILRSWTAIGRPVCLLRWYVRFRTYQNPGPDASVRTTDTTLGFSTSRRIPAEKCLCCRFVWCGKMSQAQSDAIRGSSRHVWNPHVGISSQQNHRKSACNALFRRAKIVRDSTKELVGQDTMLGCPGMPSIITLDPGCHTHVKD